MKKLLGIMAILSFTMGSFAQEKVQVSVNEGVLEGVEESGIKTFLGVPFAAPPVGNLRWKAPQPVQHWDGVRDATKFGNDPMQEPIFGDMLFRGAEKSEDCLYLNVWSPAKKMDERLPVFIYFNGGGLIAGSGSEPRYEGKQLARHGIVTITANYREGVFGFFAHKELSKETSYKGSGNYGFMDQAAAIKWVYDNIQKFGGDPNRITICGESAGSISVCLLMASPMCRDMIHQAIGSSGGALGRDLPTLAEAEKRGQEMMTAIGKKKLKELRAMPAEELMKAMKMRNMPTAIVDGAFLTEQPNVTYQNKRQADVNMLIGYNSEDIEGFDLAMQHWGDVHAKTTGKPVYLYYYTFPRPWMREQNRVAMLAGGTREMTAEEKAQQPKIEHKRASGAVHSADIEYAMGTLPTNRVYDWQPEDFVMSDLFINYYANFIKTGNPNGLGLPTWTPLKAGAPAQMLILDLNPRMK